MVKAKITTVDFTVLRPHNITALFPRPGNTLCLQHTLAAAPARPAKERPPIAVSEYPCVVEYYRAINFASQRLKSFQTARKRMGKSSGEGTAYWHAAVGRVAVF